ncbi:hypothetical protein [Spirosoma jeollabukense]
MINPFQELAERLSNIEGLLLDLKRSSNTSSTLVDAEPYGDFHWLRGTCPGIPASTLRIKSAAGEIPGVVKFGKRVLYEKALVLNWLRSQTRQLSSTALIDQQAEEQFNRQLGKRGGARV